MQGAGGASRRLDVVATWWWWHSTMAGELIEFDRPAAACGVASGGA